ncbi:MAG: helix-turn-helix domain-containing protein [Desulfovibrionaceae bacterium]|nr:helix-turn-helix domain-containing protein [Desulfovibrionaceae bacterium]
MDNIGERIRSERERLGLIQDKFAEAAHVSKRALINYEQGKRSPDAEFLTAIAAVGVDVFYVLTGGWLTARQRQHLDSALQLINNLSVSEEEKKRLEALLGQGFHRQAAQNAARKKDYDLLIEYLNDCTDASMQLVLQTAVKCRDADVAAKQKSQ